MSKKDDELDDLGLGDDDLGLDEESLGLDKDDLDFGNPELDINPEERKPFIGEVGVSFLEDIKDDKVETLKQIAQNAIPTSLSKESDAVINTYDTIKEKLEKEGHELKREARKTVRTLKRFVPDDNSLPGSLLNKLSGWLGDDEDKNKNLGPSKEELIKKELEDLLGPKNDAKAFQEAFDKELQNSLQQDIKNIQAKTSLNIERIRKFLFEVSDKYYRSSLLVSLRKLHLLQELVDVTKTGFETFKNSFEALIKNTALPEVQKIKNSELVANRLKERAVDSISGTLFGDKTPLEILTNKISSKIKNIATAAKDTLSEATDQVNQFGELSEQGITPGSILGMIVSGYAKEKAGSVIGKLVEEDEDAREGMFKVKNKLADIEEAAREYALKNSDGIDGALARFIKANAKDTGNTFTIDKEDRNAAGYLDNRTKDSINKVIPKLLSKIYSEVKASRLLQLETLPPLERNKLQKKLNTEQFELVYDHREDKLVTKEEYKTSIIKKKQKHVEKAIAPIAQRVIEAYLGNDIRQYSKEELDLLRGYVTGYVLTTGRTSSDIFKSKKFVDGLAKYNPDLAKRVKDRYSRFKKEAIQDLYILDTVNEGLASIKRNAPSFESIAKELTADGYQDIAIDLGLIKKENGKLIANRNSIIKDIAKDTRDSLVPSTVKQETLKDKLKGKGLKDKAKIFKEEMAKKLDTDEDAVDDVLGNMFSKGGYTKDGDKKEAAGIVHKGEYVINQKDLKELFTSVNKGQYDKILKYFEKLTKEVSKESKIYKLGDEAKKTLDGISNKVEKIVNENKGLSDTITKIKSGVEETKQQILSGRSSKLTSVDEELYKSIQKLPQLQALNLKDKEQNILSKTIDVSVTKLNNVANKYLKVVKESTKLFESKKFNTTLSTVTNLIKNVKESTLNLTSTVKEFANNEYVKNIKSYTTDKYKTIKDKANNIIKDPHKIKDEYETAISSINKKLDNIRKENKTIDTILNKTTTGIDIGKDYIGKSKETVYNKDLNEIKDTLVQSVLNFKDKNLNFNKSTNDEDKSKSIIDKITDINKNKQTIKDSFEAAKASISNKIKNNDKENIFKKFVNPAEEIRSKWFTKKQIKEQDNIERVKKRKEGKYNKTNEERLHYNKDIIEQVLEEVEERLNVDLTDKYMSIKATAAGVTDPIKERFVDWATRGPSDKIKNSEEYKRYKQQAEETSGYKGDGEYVAVWDELTEEEQESLRYEFFSSPEYRLRFITLFPQWLKEFKHIDPGTLGTASGIISAKFLDIKNRILEPLRKLKGEIQQEIYDRLTGKALKELTIEQEEEMKKAFFRSEEYQSGLITDFTEWLRVQGYRPNGSSIFTKIRKKLSLRNILRKTRALDKKIALGGAKLIGKGIKATGKGILKIPRAAIGGTALVGTNLVRAGLGLKKITPDESKLLRLLIPKPGLVAKTLKFGAKTAISPIKYAGTLAADAVTDTVSSIPGMGWVSSAKRPVFKYNVKQVPNKLSNKLKNLFGFGPNKENEEKTGINKLLDYFKKRDTKADKEKKLKEKEELFKKKKQAKEEKRKSLKERFLKMFSKEAAKDNDKEEDANKRKGKIKSLFKKATSLLTPTTVLLGIAGAIKAMGLSVEDIKDFAKSTVEVLKSIGSGISKGWGYFKTFLGYIKETFTTIMQIPGKIITGLKNTLSHIPGLGFLKETEVDPNTGELVENNQNDESPTVDNSTAAAVLGTTYLANKARKKVTGIRASIKKTKPEVKTTAKPDVKPKPKPDIPKDKKSVVAKLKQMLSKIKSRAVKKLGASGAKKVLAKIAARAVPIVGTAMLVYDAGKTLYYMSQGDSFLSAASKAITGVDLFEDDEDNETPTDKPNNVVDIASHPRYKRDESIYQQLAFNSANLHTGLVSNNYHPTDTKELPTSNRQQSNKLGQLDYKLSDLTKTQFNKVKISDVARKIQSTAPHIDGYKLVSELIHDEGVVLHKYRDSLGYETIGVGHLVDNKKGIPLKKIIGVDKDQITQGEALHILGYDVTRTLKKLYSKLPWLKDKPEIVQRNLGNMAFNLGVDGLLKFKKALAYIKEGNYIQGAYELSNSKWYHQVGRRAEKIVQEIASLGNQPTDTTNVASNIDPITNDTLNNILDTSTSTTTRPVSGSIRQLATKDKQLAQSTNKTPETTKIDVNTKVSLDESENINRIAEYTKQSVEIQTKMLDVLGNIASKMDRKLDIENLNQNNVQSISARNEQLPNPVVSLKRKVSF